MSDDGKRLETTVKAARSMKVTTLLETGPGKKLVSTSMSAYFENTQQYGDGGAYEVSRSFTLPAINNKE